MTEPKPTYHTRGGRRPGAGRPRTPPRKRFLIQLTPANLTWLEAYAKRLKMSRNGTINFIIEIERIEREAANDDTGRSRETDCEAGSAG